MWYGIQYNFKKKCQVEKDSESGVLPGGKAQETGGDPQEGTHTRDLGVSTLTSIVFFFFFSLPLLTLGKSFDLFERLF